MDINLSPVAVSGSRRSHRQKARPTATTTTTLKPSQSCNSCSDDQQSYTSDDREKSLNSCFTDNEAILFPSQSHNHHHSQLAGNSLRHEDNHVERDLDSPDQDYDFNSRFSPPPTDTSYHSENHCNCYDDADNEHHDTDDDDSDDQEKDFIIESERRNTRRQNQYRQKRRGGHRNCTMSSVEDVEVPVTKDTVCIIESEARGGVSSARELNEKNMAAASKARLQQHQQKVVATPSGAAKSYHNTVCAGGNGGRSYELTKNGQGANFGTVTGSSGSANEAALACGQLLDKVCINSSCSGCNKRSPAEGLVAQNNGRGHNSSNGNGSRSLHHPQGINEFIHGPTNPAAMQLASFGPQMKWTRNNIAVTMERYEPSTSSSSVSPCQSPNHSRPTQMQPQQPQTPSRHYHHFNQGHHPAGGHGANFHHDYSYAYYEPGAAMRHANIPGSPSSAGPSTSHPLPPNSIQALLLKSQGYQAKLKKQQQQQQLQQVTGGPGPSHRHAYTTRYGTQENIYEEIGNEDRMRMMMAASTNGQSMVSLNQSLVEEEFRQVHNRHRRVLGELNLSVEAMLMPVNPPVEPVPVTGDEQVAEVHEGAVATSSSAPKARGRNEFMMKPMRNPHLNLQVTRGGCPSTNGDALNGACAVPGGSGDCSQMINVDMDSGFSGSSSGASYVGSLRYQKSQCCPNAATGLMLPRGPAGVSGQRAYEDPGLSSFSTRSSSSYGSSKSSHNLQRMMRSAEDPGPSSHHHHAAMALNGMPGTSATLKPMSKNASFWSRKGWKIIPGLVSPSANKGSVFIG